MDWSFVYKTALICFLFRSVSNLQITTVVYACVYWTISHLYGRSYWNHDLLKYIYLLSFQYQV